MLNAGDYFDLTAYRARLQRNRRQWQDFFRGKSIPVFMNLCAPFLCELFGVSLRRYYTDLEVMAETQLKGIAWHLEHLDDDELPQGVFLDVGTVHEGIVFQGEIIYPENSPPWARPILEDINDVDSLQVPNFQDHNMLHLFQERFRALGCLVRGVPVFFNVHLHAPFTMAAQLLGAERLFMACYDSPHKVHKLMDFCMRAFMAFERFKFQYGISPQGLDEFVCWREAQEGLRRLWVSDDSASMVSPHIYEVFILPYNRHLFSSYDFVHLHMDGEWTHLIPQIKQYRCNWIEVGGETDWATAVGALGGETVLQGGIPGKLARVGTPNECAESTKDCLEKAEGRARVVLTVASEVYPGTPLQNMLAIIEEVRAYRNRNGIL
jgi:uroporphyrinogen decarboxylase